MLNTSMHRHIFMRLEQMENDDKSLCSIQHMILLLVCPSQPAACSDARGWQAQGCCRVVCRVNQSLPVSVTVSVSATDVCKISVRSLFGVTPDLGGVLVRDGFHLC